MLCTCKLSHYGLTDGLSSACDDTDEAIQFAVWPIRREM